ARGGGSLEDLWAFNEEIVVRAAADSDIPLISAVGHETDTTLIDYASDRRAPTPTAAAEIAVPVRLELVADVAQHHTRLVQGMARLLEQHRIHLEGLVRGIPRLESIVADKEQALDALTERFKLAPAKLIENKARDLSLLLARLNLDRFKRDLGDSEKDMTAMFDRLKRGLIRARQDAEVRFEALAARIESVSPKRVLERGYTIVRHGERVVTAAADAVKSAALEIEFADGRVPVHANGRVPVHANGRVPVHAGGGAVTAPSTKPAKRAPPKPSGSQGSLF
ncbi:MAG: exodeoxyribonuclease VII large subunit, partial [Rhodobacteraceae bacterium]|nr:exodeoxyribonuclease VII large subunit [Paracoccaceae bacterium]